MSEPDGLFDVPADAYLIPPPAEKLSRGQARRRLVYTRIATGEHPLGKGIRLHPDAARDISDNRDGLRCGMCRYRVLTRHHDKTYPKCRFPVEFGGVPTYPRDTGSESSDIRAWWPACVDWSPQND